MGNLKQLVSEYIQDITKLLKKKKMDPATVAQGIWLFAGLSPNLNSSNYSQDLRRVPEPFCLPVPIGEL